MAELALVDRDLREVPADVARSRGSSCTTLNLSENAIRPPGNLAAFTALQTLILDKNGLESLEGFPRLPTLRTLWINHNLVRGQARCRRRRAAAGVARPHRRRRALSAPLSLPSLRARRLPTCPTLPTSCRRRSPICPCSRR